MAHDTATKPAESPEVRKHDHGVAGAVTLSGAAAGAAMGAVGGPVGAVAGGAIGTAIGALIGVTMEREEVRHDAHDRELDDAIGVTHGEIGEPAEHKRPSRAVVEAAEAEAARARGEEPA
jgi:phage tail tape-measure protein